MPRFISPELLDCLRRPNPYTEYRTEVSEPDAVRVIRRADDFLGTPPLVGAMVPANSLSTDARGSLILSPTTTALQSFAGEQSSYDLNGEDPTRRIKGLSWTMDAAFTQAKLKNFTARVQRAGFGLLYTLDFELQVFRITKTPGLRISAQNVATAFTDYTFTPLLSPAPIIKGNTIVWDGANKATLNFDLSNYALLLDNTPSRAAAPDQAGELPVYFFRVQVLNNPAGTGYFKWLVDTASARTIAGKGTFERVFWGRNNDQSQWVGTPPFADVPACAINIETYPATGQAVYVIDVTKPPDTARGSIGRVVFERFLPPGTAATIELSSTSAIAGFAAVSHGDAVGVAQQTYWLRVTLTRDATTRATPTVSALGIEWRIPLDVSVEGIPQLPVRDVGLPWPKPSIPEGKLTVVRTGVRDYLDTASVIGSTQPTSKLECDIYLASRHPSVTRDKWLLLERLSVANRVPGATSETLTLLSYAAKLKKKIPQRVESINAVYTVASSTVNYIRPTVVIPGTSVGGNEYDGKGYYIRVRSTSSADIKVGMLATIQGTTDTQQLDFVPPLAVALNAADVIEVHSGIFATAPISWNDADPADVWYQLLTTYAGIPPERIGIGTLPRGGKPPRVTDIAPGDAATQAKLKVTNKIAAQESTDELLDQISAVLGGATLEMPGGQICFIQLLPLRDAAGNITVPLPPVVKTFDRRDYGASLQTPPGLEKRATVMSANYGVPLTAAAPGNYPKQTTVTVDNDALLWLTQQDLEQFGSAEVPDKIARWLYNTSDSGLYLASSLTATYVRALSTGLRLFPFNSVEKNPELMPGDSVVIVTDQYTDYEPSSKTPLRGMLAVRGVLTQVGNEGKQLTLFVPGLIDNVQSAKGGNAGALTGLGAPLDPPVLSGTFLATGELVITSQGVPGTASQRIAAGTVEPTDAFTRAGTPIVAQNITGVATGLILAAGASAWIKAFAYDAYGNESLVAKVQLTRQGSGTADPPVALISPNNGESDDTIWNIRFNAVAGSGGGGANLTYDIRQKIGFAAETSIASGNATTLPRDLVIARHPRSTKVIRFILTDTATGLSAMDSFTVPTAAPYVDNTGLALSFTVTDSGGTRPVNRMYAKALLADPDNADALITGTVQRAIPLSVIRASDNALLSRVHDTAQVGDALALSVAKRQGILFSEVFDKTPAVLGYAIAGSVQNGTLVSTVGVAAVSSNVYQMTGYEWNTYPYSIPFNPSKLYRFRCRFRCTVDPSVPSNRYVYVGLQCFDASGAVANGNGGYNYVGVSNLYCTVASGWQEWTGWFKGATRSYAAGSTTSSADPTAPATLNVNTALIRPMFSFNYPVAASTDGTYQLDYIQIDEMDEDAADRTYTTLGTGQTLKTAAKESGTKPVNRLLAKLLAADVDTLDGLPEGTSYKRINAGAQTAGNIDLALAGVVNRHAGNIADRSPSQTATVTISGVGGSAGTVNDGNPSSNAWHTDTAVPGAYLQWDFGAVAYFDTARIWASLDNYAGIYKVRGSPDGTTWTDLKLGFAPDRKGWNAVVFPASSYRYWRLELTNTPGAGSWLNEAEFAAQEVGAGFPLSHFRGLGTGSLLERVMPLVEVGSTATLRTAAKESGGKPVNRLYAKTLAGDPDNADAVVTGTTQRAILFSTLRASDNQLLTGVDSTASFAGLSAASVSRQAGHFFNESFEVLPSGWTLSSAGTLSLVSGVAKVGANVLQAVGMDWRTFPQKLPFNPTKLYRIRARVRQTVDNAQEIFYVGVRCSDAAGAYIADVYCCIPGQSFSVAAGWQEWTGWFKGSGAFVQHYSADPTAPVPLGTGTTQIQPLYILNYNTGAGTAQIDYIQIDEFDEDVSNRAYTTISSTAATLLAAAKESGTKPINRLLAKTLAADVDTLDGLPEGTSYKRINAGAQTAGNIDLALAGVTNKHGGNINRDSIDTTKINLVYQQLSNAGHGISTMQESGGKPLNRLLAKTLAADPDSLDGTPDGTTYRRITGVTSGLVQQASIAGSAVTPAKLYAMPGAALNRDPGMTDINAWVYAGGSGGSIVSISDGKVGLTAMRSTTTTEYTTEGIPFDPQKSYRVRGWVRRNAAANGTLYLGVGVFNNAGGFANGSNWDYIAASAVTPPTTWQEYVGVLPANYGYTAPITIQLIALLNYGGTLGYMELQDFRLEEVVPDSLVLDVGAAKLKAGTLNSGLNESGGKALNRLFAKVLAGDVDNQDGVGDGTTYRRITGVTGSQVQTASIATSAVTDAKVVDVGAAKLNAGNLGTGINVSTGTGVNRLLAKTLSSDPNTLDGAPDGTTYKKVAGVNSSNLFTPTSTSGRTRCRVRIAAGQSVASGAGLVRMLFDTEDYDIGGLHDLVTNTGRVTIPTGGNTGVWMFAVQVVWAADNVTGDRYVNISKNGTSLNFTQVAACKTAGNDTAISFVAMDDAPAVGDYYEVFTQQDSGVAVTTYVVFAATHLW